MISIVVPVLNRPHRVASLIKNIREATSVPYQLLFVASPDDKDEIDELERRGARHILMDSPPGPGDFARKINRGYRETTGTYIFTGADDLVFHPGWDIAALKRFESPRVGVVGTNDLGNPAVMNGSHATHCLVSRKYADEQGTIEEKGAIFSEAYHHLFVDDELVQTARARAAWAFAKDSHVEHFHPHLRDASGRAKGEIDDTYRRAFSQTNQDRELFRRRKPMWDRLYSQISVLVSTFGDEHWKEMSKRAILSVEKQMTAPAEVIVHHGRSLAEARNEAAEQAHSPWLCFLDADDELHPRFIAAMRPVAVQSRFGLLNPSVQNVLPDKGAQPVKTFRVRDLSLGNYLVISTLMRADYFWQAGGFDPQWEAWEDWALLRRMVYLGAEIKRVPQAILRVHWRSESRNNNVRDPEGLRARITADYEQWVKSR